jgi:hypothetical protein
MGSDPGWEPYDLSVIHLDEKKRGPYESTSSEWTNTIQREFAFFFIFPFLLFLFLYICYEQGEKDICKLSCMGGARFLAREKTRGATKKRGFGEWSVTNW